VRGLILGESQADSAGSSALADGPADCPPAVLARLRCRPESQQKVSEGRTARSTWIMKDAMIQTSDHAVRHLITLDDADGHSPPDGGRLLSGFG
jgi:hypothetical protein